jgi:hypothetical protein
MKRINICATTLAICLSVPLASTSIQNNESFRTSSESFMPFWVYRGSNRYCFIEKGFCLNWTHFYVPNAERGCIESFNYNIRHVYGLHVAPLRLDDSFAVQLSMKTNPAVASYEPVIFLFDTGVDRPVHGHFMSKLMQLFCLSFHGARTSCWCSIYKLGPIDER